MTPAEQIEDDIRRLMETPCPACDHPYQGEFDEYSLIYCFATMRFNQHGHYDFDITEHLYDDEYVAYHNCAWCGANVPGDIQTLIAIYRGNLTLYADPEPRLRPGESP